MSSKPPASPKPITKFIGDLSGGVNLSTSRELIEDNQAWWMEGMQPIAPGNLGVVLQAGNGDLSLLWHGVVGGESGVPSYMFTFNVAGTDYLFVVWSNSGNGYIGKANGTAPPTKYFAGNLTSGQTAAAQWNNQGVLIVDPIGYWDWNVTTAATLTALSQSVQSATIIDGGTGYSTAPAVGFTGGGGTGAAGFAYLGIGSVVSIDATGINYKVGDVISLYFTIGPIGPGFEPQLTVTTVNATGGITGLQVTATGAGAGVHTISTAVLGGAGSGAMITVTNIVTFVQITNQGHGYTTAPAIGFTGGVPVRAASATANISGFLGGTAIASYAGRAWFGNSRTVTFTDAGSYNSFIGSGSSFTIEDDYLHNTITVLYAANNYLYIFGDSSVDVLSNVSITAAGTASFSRVNISASIGCSQPLSIYSYYRAIVFFSSTGFYSLSGASPEKISDALDLLLPNIVIATNSIVSGCQVAINGILCAAWSFNFIDTFTGRGGTQPLIAGYFKGKWFFPTQARAGAGPSALGPIVSIPSSISASSVPITVLAFDAPVGSPSLLTLFQQTAIQYWRVMTKLYGGDPLKTKQAVKIAMGVQMYGAASTRAGLTVTVDDENTSPGRATTFQTGTFTGYKRLIGNNNQGGGQFIGIQATGITGTIPYADIFRIEWLAFQYADLGEWLA